MALHAAILPYPSSARGPPLMLHTRTGYLSVVSEGTLKPFRVSVYVRTYWAGLRAIKIMPSENASGENASGWSELTDPASFVVGSLLLLVVYRHKPLSPHHQTSPAAQRSTVGARYAGNGGQSGALYGRNGSSAGSIFL